MLSKVYGVRKSHTAMNSNNQCCESRNGVLRLMAVRMWSGRIGIGTVKH